MHACGNGYGNSTRSMESLLYSASLYAVYAIVNFYLKYTLHANTVVFDR